jgi:hypothetical protein
MEVKVANTLEEVLVGKIIQRVIVDGSGIEQSVIIEFEGGDMLEIGVSMNVDKPHFTRTGKADDRCGVVLNIPFYLEFFPNK